MDRHPALIARCLPLLLALPAALAQADASSPTAEATPLSRAQVEQCLLDRREVVRVSQDLSAQKAALEQRSTALIATENQLHQAHEALGVEQRALQAQHAELKRHDDDMAAFLQQSVVVRKADDAYRQSVRGYNDGVRVHRQQVEQYNADVAALNQQLRALDLKARETDRRCVKTPVRRADLEAAKAAVDAANDSPPPTTP